MLAALVCSSFAFVVSVAAQKKSDNSTIPLWFLAVVLVVVLRYGALAGVLATTLSGLVFATYLFEPLGTVAIEDADQKNSLMWMLIIGLAMSLFGRPPNRSVPKNPPRAKF